LINEAKKYDFTLYEHSPVDDIKKTDGATFKIYSDGKTFTANKVINAGGIYAPEISRMLEIDLTIHPRKGHILVASRTELMGTPKTHVFGYFITKIWKERSAPKAMYDYGIAAVHGATETHTSIKGRSRE